jgi:hypothetical protein
LLPRSTASFIAVELRSSLFLKTARVFARFSVWIFACIRGVASFRWHPRFAFIVHALSLCGATHEARRHNADASEKAIADASETQSNPHQQTPAPQKTNNGDCVADKKTTTSETQAP